MILIDRVSHKPLASGPHFSAIGSEPSCWPSKALMKNSRVSRSRTLWAEAGSSSINGLADIDDMDWLA